MIRNFFATPNIIGRLFIVLLFAGGIVYAGAFDGFVVETEASSCCGGTSIDIFSSSSNNDGDSDPDPCDCSHSSCACGAKKSDGRNPCSNNSDPYPCPTGNSCSGYHMSCDCTTNSTRICRNSNASSCHGKKNQSCSKADL